MDLKKSLIGKKSIIPYINVKDPFEIDDILFSLHQGGLDLAEITYRNKRAGETLRYAIEKMGSKMVIGAGTILNRDQAQEAISFGARFIVSPGFSEEVYEVLSDYLNKRNDDYDPLFISHKGQVGSRLTTRTIRGIIKDLLRAIDIDDKRYSAHSLRHSLATILIKNAHGTLAEAQQILRHKDISTTEIYNHALMREENDGEIKVANLLLKGEKPNE